LKKFDYSSDGAYFVTICTIDRLKLITAVNRALLENELLKLEKRFPGVKVDFYVFMPNHCHVILLFSNVTKSLPSIIQAYKSITTLQLKKTGYHGTRFWQKNYYEHVIRDDESLNRIREYIQLNPDKEHIDRDDLLRI
jgi:REP element-mobilizing transposase RayT